MIFVGNRRVNQGKSADSAEIHQDDQNKLRKNTELRCDSKGKPDRSDSGRRFVKAGAKWQTFCRADNNATDKKQQEIHYGNGCGVFHCRTVNAPAADFGIVLFATDGECTQNQNGKRGRFHTACRGAGRAADEHEQDHNCLGRTVHSGKISGIETGGSRCDRLKKRRKNPFVERQPRKIAEEKEYCGSDNEDCRCYQYDLTLHKVFFEMPLVCVNIVPGQKSNTAHNN